MLFKVSVIVPVYNSQSDLHNAVNSIIDQSFGFDNIELILVDDASTDNSKEIIKEYQSIYDNIRLVELKQNSRLPGKPRPLGMDYASADYIVFLD